MVGLLTIQTQLSYMVNLCHAFGWYTMTVGNLGRRHSIVKQRDQFVRVGTGWKEGIYSGRIKLKVK